MYTISVVTDSKQLTEQLCSLTNGRDQLFTVLFRPVFERGLYELDRLDYKPGGLFTCFGNIANLNLSMYNFYMWWVSISSLFRYYSFVLK